jgi:hypothetical protein
MKKILLFSISLLFLAGCAGLGGEYVAPDPCYTAEGELRDSVILDMTGGNPSTVALLDKLAIYEAVTRTDLVTADDVLWGLDMLEQTVLQERVSYAQLWQAIMDKVSLFENATGGELFILEQHFGGLGDMDSPVNKCDRALLLKHFGDIRAVLKAVNG